MGIIVIGWIEKYKSRLKTGVLCCSELPRCRNIGNKKLALTNHNSVSKVHAISKMPLLAPIPPSANTSSVTDGYR